jgi:hypothetical protein
VCRRRRKEISSKRISIARKLLGVLEKEKNSAGVYLFPRKTVFPSSYLKETQL